MIYVRSVDVLPSSLSLYIGQSCAGVSAIKHPTDAYTTELIWSSSNPNVATVDAAGVITAVNIGTAEIYATAQDMGRAKGSATIIVRAKPQNTILLQYIKFNKEKITMKKEATQTIATILSPSDATYNGLVWYSTNDDVATVSSKGKITAISDGTAKIVACANDGSGVHASCTVTVEPDEIEIYVNKVEVNPSSAILNDDQIIGFEATVLPVNATNRSVLWRSSDPSVISVDAHTGVAHTHKFGQAMIYAMAQDGSMVRGECSITVSWKKEYHIVPYADINSSNKRALQVKMTVPNDGDNINKTFPLSNDEKIELSRFSYVNKQRWTLQLSGSDYKIYTCHGDGYCLCKKSGNDVYVSNDTSMESTVKIIKYNPLDELVQIKLVNSDLYLTVSGSNIKWLPYDSANSASQVWKMETSPSNITNGLDTSKILTEQVIKNLKYAHEGFVVRYHTILGKLKGVDLRTNGTEEYNGVTMPRIDATILKLKDVGIDLDSDNYLKYADEANVDNASLYGKSLRPYEKEFYYKHNINIVSVYQNNGNDEECFTVKHAKLDALCALISAKLLGQPYGSAIYFAVDFNAGVSQLSKINNYFYIIKNKLRGRYKIGVYGNGITCAFIKHYNAEYSWLSQSTGHEGFDAYDDIRNYNIKQAERTYYNGIKFDDDISVGDDYGQWYRFT